MKESVNKFHDKLFIYGLLFFSSIRVARSVKFAAASLEIMSNFDIFSIYCPKLCPTLVIKIFLKGSQVNFFNLTDNFFDSRMN